MGEKPVTSFAQITSNVPLQQELQQIYGNVNNVESFVGLMAENHIAGSSLGRTEQAILAKEFEALRDGDRFFYENADSSSLVNQLNHTTLAQIIERNTSITNLQSNVFYFFDNIQGNVVTTPATMTPPARNHASHDGHNGFNGANLSSPMAGVIVELIQDGQIVDTTTTNAQGFYQFQEVGAGLYTVEVIPPPTGDYSDTSTTSVDLDITKGQSGPLHPAVANFRLKSVPPSDD